MAGNEEEWDFYPCTVEGAPASIFLDLGLESRAPLPRLATLYRIRIHIRDGGEHGMGTAAEAEVLYGVEDRIIDHARENGLTYVGRVRTRGYWELAFYGPEGRSDGLAAIAVSVCRAAGRDVQFVTTPDAEWGYYRTFLLPDLERRQWIQDRRLVETLHENGDSLAAPRRVDHWIYFAASRKRNTFITAVALHGFDVAERLDNEGGALPYGARVHRVDPVELEHIHEVVVMLVELALAHEGEYDGWETAVVRAGSAA